MSNTSGQVIKKKAAVDFKMVTFSIAGKEYAIDIMKVKEISKERNFTYVPNAPMYVLGVHNLRGEIIPIIDLRKMFHLPVNETEGGEEDVLILSVEDLTLGIVVDSIDRVVGISKEQVQEPHPLFSDVNIRYISGVVDTGGTLYVILDVERIFGKEEVLAESHLKKVTKKILPVKTSISESGIKELTLQFITETLSALKSFHVTDLNTEWVKRRFREWKNIRDAENLKLQLENIQDADDFLKPFYSPYTGVLWGDDYRDSIHKLVDEKEHGIMHVWNSGCGKGYEAYSIVCILKSRFPGCSIKVWASDNDLLNISTAPNLVLNREKIPAYITEGDFVEEGPDGFRFKRKVKDAIVFEYHNIINRNEYPDADIIIARDILSFLDVESQTRILQEFKNGLKDNGILILGSNEIPPEKDWFRLVEGNLTAYKKV